MHLYSYHIECINIFIALMYITKWMSNTLINHLYEQDTASKSRERFDLIIYHRFTDYSRRTFNNELQLP